MEAHGPRVHAEGMRGIRLGFLLQHHFAWHHETFVTAPAHTELEKLQLVAEGPDIDAFAEDEGEEAGRAGKARR